MSMAIDSASVVAHRAVEAKLDQIRERDASCLMGVGPRSMKYECKYDENLSLFHYLFNFVWVMPHRLCPMHPWSARGMQARR